MSTTDQALDAANAVIAALTKERDELKAKLDMVDKRREELHSRWHQLRLDNEELQAKLAQVEADAAAMRDVLREVADYDTGEQPSIGSDAETALKPGSGQRLLDELAKAKADRDSAYAALNSDEVASRASNRLIDELATLRETAKRRLELLRKCEWASNSVTIGNPMCPLCKDYSGKDHKPDCPLAKEINAT